MRRYIAKPRAWWGDNDWDEGFPDKPDGVTVFEEDGPEFTGRLNADGNRIYRYRDPIGFRRDDADD